MTTFRFAPAPVALAAAALLQAAPRAALADSGLIGDTVLGRPLGSSMYDLTVDRDPRGKSTMIPSLMRSPTGLSYDWPPTAPPPAREWGGGWTSGATVEAGVIVKDSSEGSNKFREYRDWRDGLLVNRLRFGMEHAGSGRYVEFGAGAVARDDQYYRASVGRYGSYRASGFFSQIPHVFVDGARSPYQGVGTGTLTLAPGLVPGNNTPQAVLAATQAASPFELGLQRRRMGLDVEATPRDDLRVFARYTHERRDGTRPFGGTLGFNFPASAVSGGVVELIEPIDYRTHEITAGVQLARERYQLNVTYTGSFFRNHVDSLTWDNPFRVSANPTATLIQRGRTDLAPDNDYHNLKADFALAGLPMRGSVSGTLSVARMRQDDPLLPYTVNSGLLQPRAGGTGAVLGTIDLADWNTTAALPRRSADARIDTWLGQFTYAFSPLEALALRAKVRSYREDNHTDFTSVNALTGQPGYLAADGAIYASAAPGFGGLFFPGNLALTTLAVHNRSVPYAHRRDNAGVEGDYRLIGRTTAEFALERETLHYDHRERARTREHRVRLGLHSRDLSWATVRASYEYGKRTGTEYVPNPYEAFTVSNRAPNVPPYTLDQMRKLDLSDRTQNVLNGRLTLLVRDNMDVNLSGKLTHNRYGTDYGRTGDQATTLNADWNWQPKPQATVYANLGWQRQRISQANINDNTAAALAGSGDGSAGGAVYPFANTWQAQSRDRTGNVGIGARYAAPRVTVESSYQYMQSAYALDYTFASPNALATAAAAGAAGGGMPDLKVRRHILETSLRFPLQDRLAVRLYHRFERGRYSDWHYDGLPLVIGNELFLGAGPDSYSVHMLGVLLQVSL